MENSPLEKFSLQKIFPVEKNEELSYIFSSHVKWNEQSTSFEIIYTKKIGMWVSYLYQIPKIGKQQQHNNI
jgi:hypothetical protein